MPLLQASHLSYQFENGDYILKNISCTLQARLTGLIGQNGSGKSILTALLAQQRVPTSGSVNLNTQVQCYHQFPLNDIAPQLTIAQYLDVENILNALNKIKQGHSEDKWFDIIADNWLLEDEVSQLLLQINLPNNPHMLCSNLSGGQLSCLRLWKLFQSNAGLLILDEPSNHLDFRAKQWLIKQIHLFTGSILLISHDRLLLREMEHIWELSSLGLKEYGGNFDFYFNQKKQQQQSVERQLFNVKKQQQQLQAQHQSNKEKADKRAMMGKKIRQKGSQSKMLLNAKKDKATSRTSNRIKQYQSQNASLQQTLNHLNAHTQSTQKQHLYLPNPSGKKCTLLHIDDGVLPYGYNLPIQLILHSNDKVHLRGANGCGKSTLFHVLLETTRLKQGGVNLNTPLFFLNQHIELSCQHQSVLNYVQHHSNETNETQIRTLLAGIGFRANTVYRTVKQLSGGEKVKLALLTVNLQVPVPLMLLDEPDNHLDIDSKQTLANMLAAYKGAFMLISHDDDFVKQCGITQSLSLGYI
ncbi:ATP-binding cassette domain-containing protein [uncultured Shewanella sp.]|uniref:ATP-binding cassette domain-containing protein n=1 Tax=uncultured Shewanella sp. TaxID=173975 RepID=UPI00262095AE|nr:ATP-binding cassette domain-containing protein [uncultured Shewanella sp.]